MTVDEFLSRVSSRELAEWQALAWIEAQEREGRSGDVETDLKSIFGAKRAG